MGTMMKAIVLERPGPPEVLTLQDRPVPKPQPGWVLIRVRAFGLNRSELETRRGLSPSVVLPRILGIEAVGEVVAAPGTELSPGQTVATVMGGMGREFDGSYAEYTCVPAGQVQALDTTLDWATLGALPEMIHTAWGSLHNSLRVQAGQTLLVRGGTTSVGLAAAVLARKHGVTVAATSRRPEREQLLRDNGADVVFVDTGSLAEEVRRTFHGGVDRILELVGTTTLLDSLQAAKRHGVVCMTGMVGGKWDLDLFTPMAAIPSSVCLTTYSSGVEDFSATPLQEFVSEVEAGHSRVKVGQVVRLEEIVEAHRLMEENQAEGKLVVLTG